MVNKDLIKIKQEVLNEFNTAKDSGSLRFIKIIMKEIESGTPSLNIDSTFPVTETFEQDFDKMHESITDPSSACFFLLRSDKKKKYQETEIFEWILVFYCSDKLKAKQKMLHSSAVDPIKITLGPIFFASGTYHCTTIEELKYEYFKDMWVHSNKRYLENQDDALTLEEKISKEELKETSSFSTPQSFGSNLTFPVDKSLEEELNKFSKGEKQFISIKIEEEVFKSDTIEDNCDANDLPTKISEDCPRFVVYNFKHKFEEKDLDGIFFIYSCPNAAKVKQRMIFSSTKKTIYSYLSEKMKIKIEKSIEVSDVKDLSSEYLFGYLHEKAEVKEKFTKPKPKSSKPRTKK
jgi:twinfilin